MSYNPSKKNPNTKNNSPHPLCKEHTLLINFRYEGAYPKELFENLGFKFQDFSDEIINLVCKNGDTNPKSYDCPLHRFTQAVLPDGWRMELRNTGHYESFSLIDQNNRKRGEYLRWLSLGPGRIGDYTGRISLLPRYRTSRHYTGETVISPSIISVKDSDDNIVYTAGTVEHDYEEYLKLVNKANDYIKRNYPECEKAYYTITFPSLSDYGTGFLYTKLDKYWD